MSTPSAPKLAIVHDSLVTFGGAERVLTYIHEVFPSAPIYTAAYLPNHTYPVFQSAKVFQLPGSKHVTSERWLKALFPLWILGFARLDLREFDVVLSSTTWGAKFVDPLSSVRHVCYCYAPTRALWNPDVYGPNGAELGPLGWLVELGRKPLRSWDTRVMRRIERVGTTCRNMASAIESCYGMSPRVIYPPIRHADYDLGTMRQDFYLSVSRLTPHKHVDLAIAACKRLGRKLVVVGEGPDSARLRVLADGAVTFLGQVSEVVLHRLYATCRALIFASHEDYGLVPLEAQASGCPIVAYGAGGILETAIEGETAVLFDRQDPEAIADAVLTFERMRFDAQAIRESVRRFDVSRFGDEIREFVLGG